MSSNVEGRGIKARMPQWVPVGECPATSVISDHSGKPSWKELRMPEFARFMDHVSFAMSSTLQSCASGARVRRSCDGGIVKQGARNIYIAVSAR